MSTFENIKIFRNLPLEDRRKKANKYLDQNPSKVPVLILNCHKGMELNHYKYLLPKSFTIKRLAIMIKKIVISNSDDALYFYANDKIIRYDWRLGDIYDLHRNDDNFLYIKMTNMPTFGFS